MAFEKISNLVYKLHNASNSISKWYYQRKLDNLMNSPNLINKIFEGLELSPVKQARPLTQRNVQPKSAQLRSFDGIIFFIPPKKQPGAFSRLCTWIKNIGKYDHRC